MNYTWKTVYGDQRLFDLARELRGESADSADDYSDDDDNDYSDNNDSDDHEFVNEEEDDDNESRSEEEEEVKDSKYSEIWHERYKQLKEYKAENGHCNVPKTYEPNKALSRWVHRQRTQYRKMSQGVYSFMTDERVEKLESIGFVWVLRSKDTWNERYEQLKEYKTEHGHCNVPKNYGPNEVFANWVSTQRSQYKLMLDGSKSLMTKEKAEKLERIGFVWSPLEDIWNERYEELKAYKSEHGHCNIPVRYQANKSLGTWVVTQRQQYKLMLEGSKSQITRERVEKLENIGFVWTPNKDIWNERLEQLKEYKAQHGHCNVPRKYNVNQSLARWVDDQRHQYRKMSKGSKSSLTEKRVEMLENIGFEWTPNEDIWNKRLKQLKDYKAQHGHCNVPRRYDANKALGHWVDFQRQQYRKMSKGLRSLMARERIEKLENIGFEWKPDHVWNERLEELKVFKAEHGHCNVSRFFESNKALGAWVGKQRHQYKLMSEGAYSNMTRARVEKLENIGFTWTPYKDGWNEMYEKLKEYKSQHGHCNVPQRSDNKALGGWVRTQRHQYTLMSEGFHSKMTQERVEKLDNIGFVWTRMKQIQDVWNERFEELKIFKAQHGHCNVPRFFESNKALGAWVGNQRYQYRHSEMTEERVRKLESIGFEWSRKKRITHKNVTGKTRSKKLRSKK